MRITPELVKKAYELTGLLPGFSQPFNKKTGRVGVIPAIFVMMTSNEKFVKHQRFHIFYDWLDAIDRMWEWEKVTFEEFYLAGFYCGLELDDTELAFIIDLGDPVQHPNFIDGHADGLQCRELFEPKKVPTQKELRWRQSQST